MRGIEEKIAYLRSELIKHSVHCSYANQVLTFSDGKTVFTFLLVTEEEFPADLQGQAILPLDLLMTAPNKIIAIVLSKLKRNRVVYARNCELRKVPKKEAEAYLNQYHLMNATSSASNYGLYYENELVALASFSTGRKMNRLKAHERSYELIRFCSKAGVTVTGGLTKLIKHFVKEKKAGDVMTYVDKQLSDGSSFMRAGFKKHDTMPPSYFLVNRNTFERQALKEKSGDFDQRAFYMGSTAGNIKMVYTP